MVQIKVSHLSRFETQLRRISAQAVSRKFERALVLVKHGLVNFPSVQSQNILKFNQGLIHLMLSQYDQSVDSLLEVIGAFDAGIVPPNDIFLRYTLQNLIIAVGLRG